VKSRFDAVVFDLGGVLIDWNPRHLYRGLFADEAAMERFLAEVCTPAWNHAMDAGRPVAEAIGELVVAHPDQAELIRAWHARWAEMLGGTYEDVVAIMRELRAGGVRVYALSNWSAETFEETRSHFPFLAEFDGILISGEIKAAKPDPVVFRTLLDRFGLEPGRTVFLDDTPKNVVAARAAGIDAILFESAARLRSDLAARGLPVETAGN
jgi:2-haloacid dehalogenase